MTLGELEAKLREAVDQNPHHDKHQVQVLVTVSPGHVKLISIQELIIIGGPNLTYALEARD